MQHVLEIHLPDPRDVLKYIRKPAAEMWTETIGIHSKIFCEDTDRFKDHETKISDLKQENRK